MRGRAAFVAEATAVAVGTGGAQLIQLAATPWLARAYPPDVFGDFAVFQSVMITLTTAACLRYEMAIPVERDDEIAKSIAIVAVCAVGLVAVLLSFIAALGGARLLPLHEVRDAQIGSLIGIGVASSGLFQLATFLGIREGRFLLTGVYKIAQVTFFVGLALLWSPGGLITAYVASLGVSAICLFHYRSVFGEITLPRLKSAAFRYKDYPLMSMPTAVLDSLALAAPILIVAHFYLPSDTGNYAQVQRIASAPLVLAAIAISQVFFKHANERRHQGFEIKRLFMETAAALLFIASSLWLAVAVFGSPVFGVLLGEGWRTDTYFLVAAITPIAIRFCVSPLSNVFMVCGRVRLSTLWQVLHFTSAFGILFWVAERFAFDSFLIGVIGVELTLYAIYWLLAASVVWRTQGRSS